MQSHCYTKVVAQEGKDGRLHLRIFSTHALEALWNFIKVVSAKTENPVTHTNQLSLIGVGLTC